LKIEHVAIWTNDLEKMRDFYERYFEAKAGEKYSNPKKNFQSYFLTFNSGARLELMEKQGIEDTPLRGEEERMGLIHLAISTGSKERVDELTSELIRDGFPCLDGPRTTGDGYYESVILDPEGNRIEVTI